MKFIAFSGGVESTTMCVLYGSQAKAIFADTGWEDPHMYARLETVEEKIKAIHPNFELIRIRAEIEIRGKKVTNLKDYIKAYKYYPSVFSRFCTRVFKIEPIDKFLKTQGECELMIGLNAEEGDKRTGNHGLMANIKYSYPLFENGVTRDSCKKILDKIGLLPELPVYCSRGGCVGCFFKTKKEFVAMSMLAPKQFDEVVELEDAIQDERGKKFHVHAWGDRCNLKELKKQGSLFKPEEMYAETEVSTPCGVFCHR